MNIIGLIIGILLGTLVSGFVIWIVGKLRLGLEVNGFGAAFVAAIIIAVVSNIVTWLLGVLGISIGTGILAAIINLVIAAIVLMISGSLVRGLRVKGFGGALVAAVAIGLVGWLVALLVNGIVRA